MNLFLRAFFLVVLLSYSHTAFAILTIELPPPNVTPIAAKELPPPAVKLIAANELPPPAIAPVAAKELYGSEGTVKQADERQLARVEPSAKTASTASTPADTPSLMESLVQETWTPKAHDPFLSAADFNPAVY